MSNRLLATISFSKSQPISWRIIDAGLCVEGQCLNQNRSCKAYRQMVIGSFSMGRFILTSSHTFQCPECGNTVRALKFGLNRCQWRILNTDKWNSVYDNYQTYDLNQKPIRIEIRALEKDYKHKSEDCTICLSSMDEEKKCSILPCKHIFHMVCIHNWIDADEDTSLQCPVCRRPIFE
ncbi:hypothetical protein I4U23_002422 [Adineta vaga]|nr:hypothetical protein I4U23_002422 [Adineta vaga]